MHRVDQQRALIVALAWLMFGFGSASPSMADFGLKWNVSAGGYFYFSATSLDYVRGESLADCDGDGVPEILMHDADALEFVAYDGQTHTPEWSYTYAPHPNHYDKLHGFVDVDADGVREAVIRDGNGLHGIDWTTGQVEWTLDRYVRAIGDFDGDGWYDLVLSDSRGGDGVTELWGAGGTPLPAGSPTVQAGDLALDQNRPNPFHRDTSIKFSLSEPGEVTLTIFDVTGRRVVELLRGSVAAGHHTLEWDGRDSAGRPVAGGVYFSRLDSEGSLVNRRMVRIR